MEIKDEKMTCLIQKKVEVEQGKTILYIALTFTSLIKAFFFSIEKQDFFYKLNIVHES